MGKTKKSYISTDYVNSEVYADNIVSIIFVDEKPTTFKSDNNKNMVRYKQNGTVIEQEVKPNLQFYYTVTDAEGNSQTKVSQFVNDKDGNVDEVSSDSGEKDSYILKEKLTDTIDNTSTSEDVATARGVYNKLYKTVTETVIDTIEHYELASVQDGTIGLKIVNDGTLTDVSTEIELSTVQAKILETDTHSYVINEYVVLVDEVNHEESHDEEIYARIEQIPEGAELMTVQEFNNMWGEVIILDYKQS